MSKLDEEMQRRFDAMSPEEKARVEAHMDRYMRAMHAVQSGVATKMNVDPKETQPKHLRVGINSAMVENSAIVHLLVSKGIISEEEWYEALADQAEFEQQLYEQFLSNALGKAVKLA